MMKRWQKVVVGAAASVLVVLSGAVGFVNLRWNRSYDHIEGPALRASADPDVIARGRYLVEGPAHCSVCHVASAEEAARVDAGERLPMRGGQKFQIGPLGRMYPGNLTPDAETGIGRYTDRQLFRMLRHSIKPDGTASLWPIMPFFMMADDELVAIVSYLRSTDPVRHVVPEAEYTFMGKVLRTRLDAFRPLLDHEAPALAPAEAATAERGEYVARYVANCMACHTAHDLATMRFTGPEFAGGAEFEAENVPGADTTLRYRSPNLTPHPSGVLARFETKDAWIARFRAGRVHVGSPMPWGPFSRMSDADLEALWTFFNTLEPVAGDAGVSVFRPGES
jgi:mono/diheme cytochrome c family protein